MKVGDVVEFIEKEPWHGVQPKDRGTVKYIERDRGERTLIGVVWKGFSRSKATFLKRIKKIDQYRVYRRK